jgi:hypothetical protein
VRERVRVGAGLYTEGGAAECILAVGSHPTAGRGGSFIWAGV